MSIKRGGLGGGGGLTLNGKFHFEFPFCFSEYLPKHNSCDLYSPHRTWTLCKKNGDFHCVSPLDLDRLYAVHALQDSWIA